MTDDQLVTVQLADDAYEAVRGINHATINRAAIPAPEVYQVLGSLKLVGHGLDQALSQLGAGLGRSLDQYDVYEDNGADPLVSVVLAVDLLTEARAHARALGELLARAQVALNGQGYRDDEPEQAADPACGCDSPAEQHGQSFHVTPQTQDTAQHRAAELAGALEHEDDPDDALACMCCRIGAPLPHRRNDPSCVMYQG
jgi:hypothetical protein